MKTLHNMEEAREWLQRDAHRDLEGRFRMPSFHIVAREDPLFTVSVRGVDVVMAVGVWLERGGTVVCTREEAAFPSFFIRFVDP